MKKILLSVISLLVVVSFVSALEAKDEKKTKSAKDYIADLSSSNENTVIKAADWIGKEEEEAAVPKLIKLLEDKRVKVRIYASIALGLIGDKKALQALEKSLLTDPNADVRYSALLAITKIGPEEKRTLEAMDKASKSDSDPYILDYLKKIQEIYKKK